MMNSLTKMPGLFGMLCTAAIVFGMAACGDDFVSADTDSGTGSDTAVVDTGTNTSVIGTGSDTTVVGTGTDTSVVDTGSDTTVVGTGGDTSVADTGSDTTIVDGGTDGSVVDTGSDTNALDTGNDTNVVDTGTDTTVIDTDVDAGLDASDTSGDESCPGCAVLSVPFTDFGTSQIFNIFFDPLLDFSGATVTFRVKAKEAGAGYLQTLVANDDTNNYASIGYEEQFNFSDILEWTVITKDMDVLAPDVTDFNTAEIFAFSFMMSAGADDGVALTNPTVLYVDSITVTDASGDVIPPRTFDVAADMDEVSINTYQPVAGSTKDHIAP